MELLLFALPGLVTTERGHGDFRKGDGPAPLRCLRFRERQSVRLCPRKCAPHLKNSGGEFKIAPPQTQKLAEAEAAGYGDHVVRLQAVAFDRLEKLRHLFWG